MCVMEWVYRVKNWPEYNPLCQTCCRIRFFDG